MSKLALVVTLLLGGVAATPAQGPREAAASRDLAIVGAKIYPSPGERPIADGVVLMRDGKIVSVGGRAHVKVPPGAAALDGSGLVVTAGFWNSHVHLSSPEWTNAAGLPAERLGGLLRDMLTRYGFTTAVDIGSSLEDTLAVRRRVEKGEIDGPRILTAGSPLYPKDGTPFYLRKLFEELKVTPPEVASPETGAALAREQLAKGADVVKIFTASPVGRGKTVTMPLETVRAIVAEAHGRGKLVYAHPQSAEGVDAAIDGGVDILAHAAPMMGPWGEPLVARMKKAGLSLVPTLTLWRAGLIMEGTPPEVAKKVQETGVAQLKAYAAAGGRVLFGTDVGYITELDTTEEFEQMSRAGMSFEQILTSLTTAPAERFGAAGRAGRVAEGYDADVTVLSGDPASDVRAFSNVKYTIRGGQVIYRSDSGAK
jgi:imidazolonepropionase-like amidohydrolase